MEFLEVYRHIRGSHGQLHLQLAPSLVDQLCEILQAGMQPSLQTSLGRLRVRSTGTNRFRIHAGLSTRVFQWGGEIFFNLLRREGVEIQIQQSSATIESPAITGSWVTGIAGKNLGIPEVVREINEWLDAGKVLGLESTRRGLAKFDMVLKLNPFLLLRKYLPSLGPHLTQVQVQTKKDVFVVDLLWNHSGPTPRQASRSSAGNLTVNADLRSLLGKLNKSQYAELKGSSANFHLECSEKFFNGALTAALLWLNSICPAASAVESTEVKGSISVDLKIQL
jgi:hypothetical protein